MTPQEFAKKIKEKYPQYSNIDDLELTNKILEKYPVYKDKINSNKLITQSPSTPIESETIQPDNNSINNLKTDLLKRGQSLKQTFTDTASGKINPLSTGLQTFGAVAGGINDVIGEGVNSLLPNSFKNVLSKSVEKIAATNTVKDITELYSIFKEKHPEAAKDLESITNIATLFPGYKGASIGLKSTGKVLDKTGKALIESGEKSAVKQSKNFASKLVTPIETKATKEAAVSRTSEIGKGLLKRSVIEPTFSEKMAIEAVQKIPGISSSKTYQQNYNLIKDYNRNLAQKLESDISTNDFIISRREVVSKLNQSINKLSDSPVIIGDAEKTARKLIEGAKKFVIENKGSGSGILKARKDYDSWVKSQKPKAFDATTENAFSLANKEIRDTLNSILERKAPNLEIRSRLKEQSSLFEAMKTISPKAALESNTALGRSLQKVGNVLGVKNKAVQAAAAVAGIGGLGAAATFAPAVAAVGVPSYLLYKGTKALLKPSVRKTTGKILKGASKLLPK